MKCTGKRQGSTHRGSHKGNRSLKSFLTQTQNKNRMTECSYFTKLKNEFIVFKVLIFFRIKNSFFK